MPWILIADQLVFAVTDVLAGFWLDRVRAGFARFGGWVLAVTAVSCLAFVALPFAGASSTAMLIAIGLWAVTSSALRSPPWLMLARHAATPSIPWLATLVLTGTAVASAMAPYLGIALRGIDPRVPFFVSTLTLLATVAGLVLAERRSSAPSQETAPPVRLQPAALFAALLLLAVGFQIHFALNSAPRYLQFAAQPQLAYLMPVFWVGFNLLMFPASALVKRLGPGDAMALAAALGAIATLLAPLSAALAPLLVAEFLAGGCWGAAIVAAYSAAVGLGRTGREGRFLGMLFAMLAVAVAARIAAVASGLVQLPGVSALLPWIPQAAWLAAGLLLLAARAAYRPG